MNLFKLDWDAGQAVAAQGAVGRLLHQSQQAEGWLVTGRTRDALENGGRLRLRRRPRCEALAVGDAAWDAARARVVYSWSAVTNDPLPEAVLDEVTLWLYARPDAQLEYMGRGRFLEGSRLAHEETLLTFDVAGGRRSYVFRVVKAPVGERDERMLGLDQLFGERAAWLNDPSARVVLSMGGGGYRLFAALTALKVVDHMLGGARGRIQEVWGSSGGALLGYVFATGLPLRVIDQLGFDLYHGRKSDLPGIHLRSLSRLAVQLVGNWAAGRHGSPELAAWVDAVNRMRAPGAESSAQVPFYTMVSNTRWRHPVAFAEPRFIADHCRDILIPCTSDRATAASMAVPFLFRPLRGLEGFENDIWFDGSIVDENPVMLPFVKWMRDRKADPERTPRRLKILLINLNMRLSESRLLASIAEGRVLSSRLLVKAAELVDLLLDSKTHGLIRTLTEIEDVEIMTATLTVGRLNFITRRDIPIAIRCGQMIEGWRLDAYPAR
jgi:hypothetical protein